MKTTQSNLTGGESTLVCRALYAGNYIRALALSGFKCTLGESKINGRSSFFLVVRSSQGFEGKFDSGCEAWNALKSA